MSRRLRLATRGSPLALAQTRAVAAKLAAVWSDRTCELVVVRTTGDRLQSVDPEAPPPGKGLFTKEIEEALLAGEADVAVHSLKDLPVEPTPGLAVAAVPEREDPLDMLIVRAEMGSFEFPEGSVVLTGSPRRRAQWRALFPGVEPKAVRGNIDTRLRKLREGRAAGLILAVAGVRRLGLDLGECVARPLTVAEMVPAPGQGALGLQCRSDDWETQNVLSKIHDPITAACVSAERAFLAAVGGGCLAPAGALARPLEGGESLQLEVAWAEHEKAPVRRARVMGLVADPEDLGRAAAKGILQPKEAR